MTKKNAVGDQNVLFVKPRERGREQATAAEDIAKSTKTTGQKTQYLELKYDKNQTTVGSRNGETEL